MVMALRALIAVVGSALYLWAAPAGSVLIPDSFASGGLSGAPPSSDKGYAAWADCDYGGALPVPVLAYNFNSVDRTSGGRSYHSSSSKALSISPTADHETQCGSATTPYCGTLNSTGGPDGSGHPGSAYYDLGSGSGTVHRGFLKQVDAPEEDYTGTNAFTISLFIKLDNKSSFATYLVAKTLEFTFAGAPTPSPWDNALCADVFAANDSTNCGFFTATDMAPYEANGVWDHWAFVYEGGPSGRYEIFKNGVSQYTQAVTGSIGNSGGGLTIGAVNGWGFDGGLDEFAIFDTALSDGDILELTTCVVPE